MKKNLILFYLSIFILGLSFSAGAQCSGTPAPGIVNATVSSGCFSYSSDLSLSGAGSGIGIVYQWESSPDDITFLPIGGATNSTYTATVSSSTYFHCIVTCSITSSSATTPDKYLVVNTVADITGTLTTCAGYSTNLADVTTGGTWSSEFPAVATVNSLSGVVSGITAGVDVITYTSAAGCTALTGIIVYDLPAAITGFAHVCEGAATTLSDATPSGTWTSSNAGIASVGAASGIVTGVLAGNAVITYTVVSGCFNLRTVTVDPLPAPITGSLIVCEGATTTLNDITPGGGFSSATPATASIGFSSGALTGILAGTTTISYTITATSCTVTRIATVYPTPAAIMGSPNLCLGSATTFSNAMSSGHWSSSNTAVATIGSSTGIAAGVTVGTTVITYTVPTGSCFNTVTATVHPLPTVYNVTVTGTGSYCAGGTGVPVGLDGSDIGTSYLLHHGTTAIGYIPGTGTAIDFGLVTVAGVYTATALDVTTGCSSAMSDSAVVTILPLVTPSVTISSSPGDTVCQGASATLTPLPVYGGTSPGYVWKVNGTIVSMATTYNFLPANGDIVTIKLTSNYNCASPDTATDTVIMHVLPNMLPSVTTAVSPSTTVCQYNGITLTATPSSGGSSPVYLWLVGSSVIGTGSTISYIPINGDVVSCKLVSDYQCRLADTVASSNTTITVLPLTLPYVIISASPGFVVDSGTPVTLSATVANAGPTPTYQWVVNGLPVAGATNSTFLLTSFANFDSVAVVVTSSGICNGISTFDWVFVSFTPIPLETGSIASMADIRMLPNPNKGAFTITGTLGTTTDEMVSLDITNMLGQVMYRSKVPVTAGKINEQVKLGTLANGMYILNVQSSNERKAFHFVVEQ